MILNEYHRLLEIESLFYFGDAESFIARKAVVVAFSVANGGSLSMCVEFVIKGSPLNQHDYYLEQCQMSSKNYSEHAHMSFEHFGNFAPFHLKSGGR
jgi:hypothetical protein